METSTQASKNYYPQVLLEECKYVVKKNIPKHIIDDIEIFSDLDTENSYEENSDIETFDEETFERKTLMKKILMKKIFFLLFYIYKNGK